MNREIAIMAGALSVSASTFQDSLILNFLLPFPFFDKNYIQNLRSVFEDTLALCL
jgi:hypothetical protein